MVKLVILVICTGAEWVKCVSGRWLHEDCIPVEDNEQDENGGEKLCSLCV